MFQWLSALHTINNIGKLKGSRCMPDTTEAGG